MRFIQWQWFSLTSSSETWSQCVVIVWSVPGEQEIISSQKWKSVSCAEILEIPTAETASFVNATRVNIFPKRFRRLDRKKLKNEEFTFRKNYNWKISTLIHNHSILKMNFHPWKHDISKRVCDANFNLSTRLRKNILHTVRFLSRFIKERIFVWCFVANWISSRC